MMTDSEVERPKMGPITREEDAKQWRETAEELFKASSPVVAPSIRPNAQKDVPPPSIQALPAEHAHDISRYKYKPKFGPAEGLQKCADAIEKYDAEECKAHREEIDTLLVFAGLFSAVVTAFSIESYQWLQSDPNDTIIVLLSQIAHSGGSQPQMTAVQTGLPDAVSVRVNAYWFLSLALSLSAALVAILCKQWVREFERHPGLSDAKEFISIRQMKLEGFEGWHVAGVVATIPLLLQCALGLFALGLVDLFLHLHRTVAIVVLVPTTTSLIFYAFTTLLPGVQAILNTRGLFFSLSQCPFKSPQAMLLLRLLVLLHIAKPIDSLRRFYRQCEIFLYRVRASFGIQGDPPYLLPPGYRGLIRDFLTFYNTRSWLTVDRKFTSDMDEVYAMDATLRSRGLFCEVAGPAGLSFYFRGLVWLRDHVDQPGMQSWIFWSIWYTIPVLQVLRDGFGLNVDWAVFQSGIDAIFPDHASIRHSTWMPMHPADLVLVYACYAEIEPGFISEALIHYSHKLHFDALLNDLRVRTFLNIDSDTMLSIIYVIMGSALADAGSSFHLRDMIDNLVQAASHALIRYPGSLPPPTLACIAALLVRNVSIEAGVTYFGSRYKGLEQLFRAVITASREGSANPPSLGEKAAFAAFALVVDQDLSTYISIGKESATFELLCVLDDAANQDAYLDLLATALRSRDEAEDHVKRYAPYAVERARRRYDGREGSARTRRERGLQSALAPAGMPGGSSEPVPSGTGAPSSGGADTAQGASDAPTATHAAAPSGRDPDDPGSSTPIILPQPPGLWLGDSRTVVQSAPDAEPGPAGLTEDNYDGLSLLASPTGLAPEISGTEEDAEFAQALSLALGEYAMASSRHSSLDHENTDAAAADAEQITATSDGDSTGWQTGLGHENLSAGVLAPAGAEQRSVISPADNDATRPPESQAGQAFRIPSASSVTPRGVDSGTTISAAAPETDSTGAPGSQERDAGAVAEDDLRDGEQGVLHGGDEIIALEAQADLAHGDPGAAALVLEVGTVISATAASKGAQDVQSVSESGEPSISAPSAQGGVEISALDVQAYHGDPGAAAIVLDLGTASSATPASKGAQDGQSISEAAAAPADVEPGPTRRASTALGEDASGPHTGGHGQSISEAAAAPADVEPGPTRRASTALGEDETGPHTGGDDVRTSATALGTEVSAMDDEVTTEYLAGPEPESPAAA